MKFAKTKLLSLSVALALASTVAQAQDTEQEANDDEDSKKLERVTVTATRRGDTDILTTPVAVTAVTPEEFEVVMPNNVGDVAAFVPNFSAALITNFNAASFSMRGIGQTDIIVYLDPPVGVTVDDFVMPSVQTQLLEVFDIESIEVLRGPQGTLYGKNTTGGAINIRTKRPEIGEGGGQVIGQVGSFGKTKGQLAVNVPIGDSWAFRFAGVYDQSDGYYKNGAEYGPIDPNNLFYPIPGITGTSGVGDGSDVGGKDVFAARAKLLFEPSSNFEALFQYEIIRDESDSAVTINETPIGDPRYVFNNLGWTQDIGGDPLDHAGFTNRDDALLLMSQGHRVDVDGLYLNIDWDISDTLAFSSLTGYRDQESRLPNSYGAEVGPISQFDATRDDNRETFQQEFRLQGNHDDMSWVAGVFYQENDADFCVNQILGFLDLFGLGAANFGDDLFFTNNPQVLCNKQQADALAVYGDISFDLNERWNLTLGARYTDEEKSWQGRNQIFYQQLTGGFDPNLTWHDFNEPLDAGDFGRYPTGVVSDSESWGEPTYRATLGYDFSQDTYGYFTYSRGFKSGGYNDQTGTSGNPITALQARPYDPEFANSYEAGIKSTLGNGRVYVAATAFYVEYEDAQRSLVSTIRERVWRNLPGNPVLQRRRDHCQWCGTGSHLACQPELHHPRQPGLPGRQV